VQRQSARPRPDWQRRVESQGLHFHTPEDEPYWNEEAYYSFTGAEVDRIERATYALDDLCLKAVEHVIQENLFAHFRIPPPFIDFVKHSWENDEHTIYGRFDLAFDPAGEPRLLEYNADTPTALLEAAVIQWFWLKDTHPDADQFNNIHERLLEIWSSLRGQVAEPVYFTSLAGHVEDYLTVTYLRDTALQAGLQTAYLAVDEIGWNSSLRRFVDLADRPLGTVFKLYPWEWMLAEQFGPRLLWSHAPRWFEPPWKMLLSNKAILPILHDLFPESPYLLPAAFGPLGDTYIQKPLQAREGANIKLVMDGQVLLETDGPYGGGPSVYQEVMPLPNFDGHYPVIGSWIVNGYACGMGIREDRQPITQNTSRFVPHLFVP
jgi:glutathionylspermidine synthase